MKYWLFCNSELQFPSGGIEAEAAVAIANSTKALTGYANYAPTTFPASVLVAKEEEKAKKHLLWLKLNTINHVYGDWIDDPNLPSAVKT